MYKHSTQSSHRRHRTPFVTICGGAALGILLTSGVAFASKNEIKIGMPVGLSGANSIVAPSVVQAAKLAIAEINAKGGILGKKVVLDVADDESGADGAVKAFDALIYRRHVNAIITMETSAARNAGLPVVARSHTPYIYTSYYEGHSCSPYLFVDAWVPQQVEPPIISYFMNVKGAKTFYLIGSDYAFGRGMLKFARNYIEAHGGKVLGESLLPLGDSDWTSIISKMEAAHPDAILSSTAGGAPNVTLMKQMKSAGVNVLYGNLALDEGTAKAIGQPAVGVYMAQSYFTELNNKANAQFMAGLKKKFGTRMKTPNGMSEPEYDGIYLYKAAVEKAGTTKWRKVLAALPTVSFDGPRGKIQMSHQHHTPMNIYIGRLEKNLSVNIIKTYHSVSPGAQCPDLPKW